MFAGSANTIDRTGAEALIPEQTSREIIQGVTEQSTVPVSYTHLDVYKRQMGP